MIPTEHHWYSALNYLSPVLFDGSDRRSKIKNYAEPKQPLKKHRRNITKEALAKLHELLEPLVRKHHYDSDVYQAIKDHEILVRPDGIKHSEWTVRLYIHRLRKKLGGIRPPREDKKSDIAIKMINAGYSMDDICKMADISRDYYGQIKKRAKQKGLLNIIQKD